MIFIINNGIIAMQSGQQYVDVPPQAVYHFGIPGVGLGIGPALLAGAALLHA